MKNKTKEERKMKEDTKSSKVNRKKIGEALTCGRTRGRDSPRMNDTMVLGLLATGDDGW